MSRRRGKAGMEGGGTVLRRAWRQPAVATVQGTLVKKPAPMSSGIKVLPPADVMDTFKVIDTKVSSVILQ